jgi:hypothetical protein
MVLTWACLAASAPRHRSHNSTQNCLTKSNKREREGWSEPYIYTVYDRILVISLLKIPYIHRIIRVLANPKIKQPPTGSHLGMPGSIGPAAGVTAAHCTKRSSR